MKDYRVWLRKKTTNLECVCVCVCVCVLSACAGKRKKKKEAGLPGKHGLTSGHDGGSHSQGTNPMPSILRVHQRKVPFLPHEMLMCDGLLDKGNLSSSPHPAQAPPRPADLHVCSSI